MESIAQKTIIKEISSNRMMTFWEEALQYNFTVNADDFLLFYKKSVGGQIEICCVRYFGILVTNAVLKVRFSHSKRYGRINHNILTNFRLRNPSNLVGESV